MADALRPGGLYKRGETFVNAEGEEVKGPGKAAKTSEAPESDLPEDFPGRSALIKAGHTAQDQVDALDRDALIAIKGIGEATADEILALREG